MLRKEKGITMVALVITIILMMILLGATVYYGSQSLQTTRLQNFNYELQQIQGKVDVIYQKMQEGDIQYINWGKNITTSKEAVNTLRLVTGVDYSSIVNTSEEYYYTTDITKYRLFTPNDLNSKMGISSMPGDMIINFETREVISVKGFEYDGVTYYRIYDLNGSSGSTSEEDMIKVYSKEGLMLYYDGINNTRGGHDDKATTWTDLSGNDRDAELKYFSYTEGSGWSKNGIVLDGTDDGIWVGDHLKDLFKDKAYIELTLNLKMDNARDILMGNHNNVSNNMSFERYNNTYLRFWWNSGKPDHRYNKSVFTANTLIVVGYEYDKEAKSMSTYVNGKFSETYKSDNYAENQDFTKVWIGRDSRTGETVMNGTIHAVRIYNRLLTQEEKNMNYITDKERFGV